MNRRIPNGTYGGVEGEALPPLSDSVLRSGVVDTEDGVNIGTDRPQFFLVILEVLISAGLSILHLEQLVAFCLERFQGRNLPGKMLLDVSDACVIKIQFGSMLLPVFFLVPGIKKLSLDGLMSLVLSDEMNLLIQFLDSVLSGTERFSCFVQLGRNII